MIKDPIPTPLTPTQSADVISYYDRFENPLGTRQRIPLARVAIHAALKEYSIVPSGEALLTFEEANEGLAHLSHEDLARTGGWPVEPTDTQWEEIYKVSDSQSVPVDEAYYQVMGIEPSHWK